MKGSSYTTHSPEVIKPTSLTSITSVVSKCICKHFFFFFLVTSFFTDFLRSQLVPVSDNTAWGKETEATSVLQPFFSIGTPAFLVVTWVPRSNNSEGLTLSNSSAKNLQNLYHVPQVIFSPPSTQIERVWYLSVRFVVLCSDEFCGAWLYPLLWADVLVAVEWHCVLEMWFTQGLI